MPPPRRVTPRPRGTPPSRLRSNRRDIGDAGLTMRLVRRGPPAGPTGEQPAVFSMTYHTTPSGYGGTMRPEWHHVDDGTPPARSVSVIKASRPATTLQFSASTMHVDPRPVMSTRSWPNTVAGARRSRSARGYRTERTQISGAAQLLPPATDEAPPVPHLEAACLLDACSIPPASSGEPPSGKAWRIWTFPYLRLHSH